jgi:hypothetical protein
VQIQLKQAWLVCLVCDLVELASKPYPQNKGALLIVTSCPSHKLEISQDMPQKEGTKKQNLAKHKISKQSEG